MISSTVVRPSDPTLHNALRLAGLFALIKLLLHFALTLWTTHLGYGYFRDEFYYLVCGRHLAWGYVDQGPLVAVQARLGEILFGDSLFAIRILSTLAGAIMVFLTGLIAWALGGRRSAQALGMIGVICSPQFIGTDGFLSMNSCESMFWMACILALLLILRGYSPSRCWVFFGISAGLGLLNKPSMVFFLVALGIGLLCTEQRKLLFTRWAALGIALLILIALPNVLWQVHNHWPTLEFLQNGKKAGKNVALSPVAFLSAQILGQQPFSIFLWLTGVIALLRAKSIARARWLGITFLAFYAIMQLMHAKDYYLSPLYPAFFAAGAIAWEFRFAASHNVEQQKIFGFPLYESLLILTSILVLPLASPVLRPEAWLRYTTAMHLYRPEAEKDDVGNLLPQFFADRFGWQELTDKVSAIYTALSPADQARVCVFTSNYGEAGALEFLGRIEGKPIPRVISGHNNYWLWGIQGCSGDLMISVIGDTPDEVGRKYEDVVIAGRNDAPWSMPWEHRNIYLLRGRRPSAPVNWQDEKYFY